jgi:hypothetical protein
MRVIELPPIEINLTNEEIVADLLYPDREGGR